MEKSLHDLSGQRGTVVLSFDDGRGDQFAAAQHILKPLRIPATFCITTGYVDGSCPEELRPSAVPAMDIAQVRALAADPLFELALHGDRHLNTAEDVARCREKLLRWLDLPPTHRFGFASPGSGLDLSHVQTLRQEPFRSGISYIRASLRYRTRTPLRILARKAGRVVHAPALYRIAYRDTLMEPGSGRVLYSVPVMGDISAEQVIALAELCTEKQLVLVLMLHSIGNVPEPWSWSPEKLKKLCDHLASQRTLGRLELRTMEQLWEGTRP